MFKALAVSTILLLITACGESSQQTVQFHTQGEASQDVVANQYDVYVRFKVFAKQQQLAGELIGKQVSEFATWAKGSFENALELKNKDLQPVYQYRQKGQNQLTGYHAVNGYLLKGLDKAGYDKVMAKLPNFNPDYINTQKAYVAESAVGEVKSALREQAFNKAKENAEQLAKLAGACELKASDVKEFWPPVARPMLMAREASISSQQADAKQSLNVRLEVSWSGMQCIR